MTKLTLSMTARHTLIFLVVIGMSAGNITVLSGWSGMQEPEKSKEEKTLTTERVEIVDALGRVRILLEVTKDDSPRLVIMDSKGRKRAEMTLRGNAESALTLYDLQDRARTSLLVNQDEEPQLQFWDSKGKLRMDLLVNKNEFAGLRVMDGAEKKRVIVGVQKDVVGISLLNEKEQQILEVGSDPKGTYGILLKDAGGKTIWSVPGK